ncbi:MAG: hypothetical protein K6T73_03430 [Candidatus Bathyarchaeota archaeon]|nr:hypothetical protein [Candidatus Bathyarchaeota archaeon]
MILNLLHKRDHRTEEIAAVLKLSKVSTLRILKKLCRKGLICRHGGLHSPYGKWFLRNPDDKHGEELPKESFDFMMRVRLKKNLYDSLVDVVGKGRVSEVVRCLILDYVASKRREKKGE